MVPCLQGRKKKYNLSHPTPNSLLWLMSDLRMAILKCAGWRRETQAKKCSSIKPSLDPWIDFFLSLELSFWTAAVSKVSTGWHRETNSARLFEHRIVHTSPLSLLVISHQGATILNTPLFRLLQLSKLPYKNKFILIFL